MIDLRAAPGEGATLQDALRYLSYLREQIQYLNDLWERQTAEIVAAMSTAAKEE